MQMKIQNILKCLFVSMILLENGVVLANLYKVTNVPVSAERESALAAKDAALSAGQLTAFNRLITKLSPDSVWKLPQMTEESVLPYVQGVSIESEKTTATKYMGSIAVEFNPSAVRNFLSAEKVTYLKAQAPSLLVIPKYIANGKILTLDPENPLYTALKEKKDFAPFYQAVVPTGTEEEKILLQQGDEAASALLSQYGKEKLMILQLMAEGNDIWQITSSFYPTSGMQNQVIYKRFRYSSGDPKVAAGQMANVVFSEMESKWRGDKMSSLADKQTLYLRITVDSLAEWLRLDQEMKDWTFFEETELRGLYLPQVLVDVTYKGDLNVLSERLLALGWQLNKDTTGNGGSLKKVNVYE